MKTPKNKSGIKVTVRPYVKSPAVRSLRSGGKCSGGGTCGKG